MSAADLLLDGLVHLAAGLVDGGQHQVLEHLHVFLAHHLGVDLEAAQLLLAVHLDLDDAAAGGGLDDERRDLGLDLLLRLLELLHQLAWVTEGVHGSSLEGFGLSHVHHAALEQIERLLYGRLALGLLAQLLALRVARLRGRPPARRLAHRPAGPDAQRERPARGLAQRARGTRRRASWRRPRSRAAPRARGSPSIRAAAERSGAASERRAWQAPIIAARIASAETAVATAGSGGAAGVGAADRCRRGGAAPRAAPALAATARRPRRAKPRSAPARRGRQLGTPADGAGSAQPAAGQAARPAPPARRTAPAGAAAPA